MGDQVMEQQTLKCPVCGGANIETTIERREFPLAFGEAARLDVEVNRCRACGEMGDFLAVNDQSIEDALAAAEGRLAAKNIEALASQGFTMASCERALGLAPRTMMRWKSGKLSDAAGVLLKILRTFPWILNVARANFSRVVAEEELRRQAVYAKPRSAPDRSAALRFHNEPFSGATARAVTLPTAYASPSQGIALELAS
jgi:transcriptional regulator with XRE-family HTH domain